MVSEMDGDPRAHCRLTKHCDDLPDLCHTDGGAQRQRHKRRRKQDADPTKRPPSLSTTSVLVHRAAKACHVRLTGTSITATARRVRLAPMTSSLSHRPANSSSMHATDAGNETDACLKSVSTPKQATRITRMPVGMNIHDRNVFSLEFHSACEVSEWIHPWSCTWDRLRRG